jgi:hypothetical protein
MKSQYKYQKVFTIFPQRMKQKNMNQEKTAKMEFMI